MAFNFDSKYEVDAETALLPSTVEFFPDISQFEEERIEIEEKYYIPEWSLKKIGTLQSRLEILKTNKNSKTRFGQNSSFYDFPSSVLLNLANDVFGFDGWSTEILESNLLTESFDEVKSVHSAKFSALIRVTLKDGTYSDAFGTGEATNLPHKYMCFSKGKKQAVTDGTKKAILGLHNIVTEHELRELQEELAIKYEKKGK